MASSSYPHCKVTLFYFACSSFWGFTFSHCCNWATTDPCMLIRRGRYFGDLLPSWPEVTQLALESLPLPKWISGLGDNVLSIWVSWDCQFDTPSLCEDPLTKVLATEGFAWVDNFHLIIGDPGVIWMPPWGDWSWNWTDLYRALPSDRTPESLLTGD